MRRPSTGFICVATSCLLAIAAAAHYDASFSPWQIVCYLASAVLLPLGLRAKRGNPGASPTIPWERIDTMLLTAVFVPAVVLRAVHLSTVPIVIFSDEISYTETAVNILRGHLSSPFASGPWDSLFLHHYMIAGAYFITPSMTDAARLVGVVPGLVAILLEYVVLRRLFGRPMAFIASAFMSLMAWNILIDRYSYHWSINQFTELLAIYYLIVALRSEKPIHFVLSGYGLGLGVLYTYNATFLPIGFALFFCYLGVFHRTALTRRVLAGFALTCLAALMIAGPRLTIALADPSTLSYHQSVSVTKLSFARGSDTVVHQFAEILYAFNFESDTDPRAHPRGTGPLLDPIMAAALGLSR